MVDSALYEEYMGKKAEGLDVPELKIKDIEPTSPTKSALYYEYMGGGPEEEDDDGPAIDMGGTLKKKDLYKRDNVNTIRNFMVGYRGVFLWCSRWCYRLHGCYLS
jgi:hypothetical protein